MKDFSKKAKQWMFDKAISFVIEQGKASVTKDGKCMYRGPKGTKCAIGALIPDKLYTRNMDTYSSVDQFIPGCAYSDPREAFLSDLQECHDYADDEDFVNDVRRLARKMAKEHGLNDKVCK